MPNPDATWNRADAGVPSDPYGGSRWRRFTASLPMRTALVAVAAVWLLGAVWSFTEQSAFAGNKGFSYPHLLPLVIDGFAVAMAGVAWAASLDARPAVAARLATVIAVAASSASNGAWAYLRTNHDLTAVVLGVAVPIAANLAFEVLLAEMRRQVQRRRGLPPPVAIPYPRFIRLGLAPFRTFVEWRALVLDLTAMDLAVARPGAVTASAQTTTHQPETSDDQAPAVGATRPEPARPAAARSETTRSEGTRSEASPREPVRRETTVREPVGIERVRRELAQYSDVARQEPAWPDSSGHEPAAHGSAAAATAVQETAVREGNGYQPAAQESAAQQPATHGSNGNGYGGSHGSGPARQELNGSIHREPTADDMPAAIPANAFTRSEEKADPPTRLTQSPLQPTVRAQATPPQPASGAKNGLPVARRRDLEAVPAAAPARLSAAKPPARTSTPRRAVDPRVELLAAHLASTEDAGEFTGEMVGPLLNIDVAPRTGRRLLGLARELVSERAQTETDPRDDELSAAIGGG